MKNLYNVYDQAGRKVNDRPLTEEEVKPYREKLTEGTSNPAYTVRQVLNG